MMFSFCGPLPLTQLEEQALLIDWIALGVQNDSLDDVGRACKLNKKKNRATPVAEKLFDVGNSGTVN